MKKITSLLLALVMALSLAACAVQPRQAEYQSVNIRLGGLKGPTSMGMAKLLDDAENGLTANTYEFTMAASANELTPKLIQGELDILAVPANVGAILYNQTQGQVQLIAASTLGVLYIVEKGGETVTDVKSLAGKTIYATGKGATPEYALTYLLAQNGLTLGGRHRRVEERAHGDRSPYGPGGSRHCHAAPALCHRGPRPAGGAAGGYGPLRPVGQAGR